MMDNKNQTSFTDYNHVFNGTNQQKIVKKPGMGSEHNQKWVTVQVQLVF